METPGLFQVFVCQDVDILSVLDLQLPAIVQAWAAAAALSRQQEQRQADAVAERRFSSFCDGSGPCQSGTFYTLCTPNFRST